MTQARGDFCGRSSRSSRMFRSEAMSKPSAESVARHTSVARSFVYVESSGESRRMYAMWADEGCSSRSDPSRRSNQLSRIARKAASTSSLAATSTDSSSRSEICFSSSVREIGSGSSERSASSSRTEEEKQISLREPLLVELSGLLLVQRAEVVSVLVVRQDRESGERGTKRELLALEGDPCGEDRVLALVVFLRKLRGYQTAFAGLAEPIEPLLLLAGGGALLLVT